MKLKLLLFNLILCLTFVSCIKDEAPNAEADILTCTVPGDILKMDPIITNDKITILVKKDTPMDKLAPEFTLTPGASIEPASGKELNFTTPQYYTVTSQDGKWKKKYEVTFIDAGISTIYHFENYRQDGKYQVFFEKDENGNNIMDWASGNPGYALTGTPDSQTPTGFPTVSSDGGKEGKCLKLETKSTGPFGEGMNMPIAAGNLFMGEFNVLSALSNALKATRFGRPFDFVPTYLTGYYKYKAGSVFSEDGKPVDNKKDKCDIYAIFYEPEIKIDPKNNKKETILLDGTNALTSPNLISIARIDNQKETDEWTQFYIPFISLPGKTIDKDKLNNGKYYISIVFSSSIEGDKFKGAVGSTLYIDEVQLMYKEN